MVLTLKDVTLLLMKFKTTATDIHNKKECITIMAPLRASWIILDQQGNTAI